jgi:hypothetical protein
MREIAADDRARPGAGKTAKTGSFLAHGIVINPISGLPKRRE